MCEMVLNDGKIAQDLLGVKIPSKIAKTSGIKILAIVLKYFCLCKAREKYF